MSEHSKKPKLLIAEPSSLTLREIFKSPLIDHFTIETAANGPECIQLLETFKPDLLVVELLLPKMHGIEILKYLKIDPNFASIGVIVTSSLQMLQNYNAAIDLGALYFLPKPYTHQQLFHLIERFFDKNLSPDPFTPLITPIDALAIFHPNQSDPSSPHIKFWGTRGSCPVSGAQYLQYGGNTCCLEIRDKDVVVIIDAGSGIRELGEHLNINPNKPLPILLSHTHWDHIIGFPFFGPAYDPRHQLDIYSPIGYQKEAEALFHDMLAYGYFPIRLEEMRSKLTFKELRDSSSLKFGSYVISCHYANHPGPTLCFKIKTPKKTIGYVTDNEILIGYHGDPLTIEKEHPLFDQHLSLLHFLDDCDILIHEAQYLPKEYLFKAGWGHSSANNVVALLRHLKNCKEWIICHHDPKHTDEDLNKKAQLHKDLVEQAHLHLKVKMAYDGMTIPI
jgi:phosphoribosyl 1,2-cyclic phosphodiesterase/DNA-binding NarL/FixJ family response regulator